MSGISSGPQDRATSLPDLTMRLWPQPVACAAARRAVRVFCTERSLAQLADDAELLTSELIANAITHSGALVTLVATCTDTQLVVSVRDDDPRPSLVAATAETFAESGRGLQLVAAIAGAWGTTPHPVGKSVWFRLP